MSLRLFAGLFPASGALFATLLAAMAVAPQAHAQSRREQAAIDVLQQRMDAAEKHYREGLLAEDDASAATATKAALGDMEGGVTACAKQRGCDVKTMLVTYERLLKATAPTAGDGSLGEDFDDPIDEGDLADGAVPNAASASALLGEDGQRFVKMVQFNPAVQAGIRRWLTDMRPSLMDSYENYRYMQHLMSPAFKRQGLPEALLFGIMAKESNGKVHVGSRAGAVGPMQFMPATGKRFGLGDDGTGFDTRYDPRSAADAAAAYLSERMRGLDNSIELSLAAYNGGEGRAARVFQSTGGRNFWDADVYNQFPAETKDYVPMVIAAAWLYLHPRDYGISWPRVSTRPAVIKLAQPTSIYELAICLGNSGSRDGYMRALRNLNPRFEADSWLAAGTLLNATARVSSLYDRYCLPGKQRAQLAKQLVSSNVRSAVVQIGPMTSTSTPTTSSAAAVAPPIPAKPSKPAKPKSYTVKRGDTLTDITRKLNCEARNLAQVNKLKAPKYAIRPGQTLSLAGCKD
ncbi:MAG: transglycosylase SLT domain-containing protein [Thermomonas sp.]